MMSAPKVARKDGGFGVSFDDVVAFHTLAWREELLEACLCSDVTSKNIFLAVCQFHIHKMCMYIYYWIKFEDANLKFSFQRPKIKFHANLKFAFCKFARKFGKFTRKYTKRGHTTAV